MKLNSEIFHEHISFLVDLKKIDKLLVAVSGGADSMCLITLLDEIACKYNIEIIAVGVDHKLRKESYTECQKTAAYLNSVGIKYDVLEWKHNDNAINSNLQKKARDARYNLLYKYCKEHFIKTLCIAHNYEDQAETVFLNILRGSGIDGVSGMPEVSDYKDIKLIRPLLRFSRSDILLYLNKNNVPWVEDPSNLNEKFYRVKVRKLFKELTYGKKLIQRLNLLAHNSSRVREHLDHETEKCFLNYCSWGDLGEIFLKKNVFTDVSKEILLRLFNKIFACVNNYNILHIRLKSLERLYLFLKDGGNTTVTLGKLKIKNTINFVCFYKEPKFVENIKKLKEGDNFWDNRYLIKTHDSNLFVKLLEFNEWCWLKKNNLVVDSGYGAIFSTPVIITKDFCYHPILKIFSSPKINISVEITHIKSGKVFKI